MDAVAENSVVVSLTESAANHIKTLLAKEKASPGKALRVFIENGGCSVGNISNVSNGGTGGTAISPPSSMALRFWWTLSAPRIFADR